MTRCQSFSEPMFLDCELHRVAQFFSPVGGTGWLEVGVSLPPVQLGSEKYPCRLALVNWFPLRAGLLRASEFCGAFQNVSFSHPPVRSLRVFLRYLLWEYDQAPQSQSHSIVRSSYDCVSLMFSTLPCPH